MDCGLECGIAILVSACASSKGLAAAMDCGYEEAHASF
jgi:hypothetical protein